MPPAPRKQELHALIVDEPDDSPVKGEKVKAPILTEKVDDSTIIESDYPSLAVFSRTVALASVVGFGLHHFGLFETHFWYSVFIIAMTMEASSPAVHNFAQYLFPIYMSWYFIAAGVYPSLVQLLFLPPTYLFLVGVPMSVCLHRYFSHAAFQTTRLFQCVLAVVSTFAYQGGCLWWAAKHVRHHHHCDQPEDPHSVVQKGYFYAFMGWTMNPKNTSERDYKYNNPDLFLPELYFLDRFYHAPTVIAFTLIEAHYSRSFVVFSVLSPMLVCRCVTLLFNVEYHPATDPARCKSINQPQILADIVGESDHETHHRKPALCKRGNMDLAYWLTLSWMEPIGLVWSCR